MSGRLCWLDGEVTHFTATSKRTNIKAESRGRETEENYGDLIGLWGNDGTSTAMDRVHNSRIRKLLAVLSAVTLDNIRYSAERDTADKVLKMLHREEISPAIFKRLLKSRHDC